MDAPDTALHGQNTTTGSRLYMALELGEKSWKLSLGDCQRAPSRYTVAAGNTTAVLAAVANARSRCHLGADTTVYSCYEAGRDGFWLHRCLEEQGVVNLVVDSASIEVNRRARRAKTDRLDSDKLLSMLIRYHTGERRMWAVARIPTPEQEDDRRLHRELERLRHERTAHTNRVRFLLVLHNLRVKYVGGRLWTYWWARQRELLLPGQRAEIEREYERLALVRKQMRLLEAQQNHQVRSGAHPGMTLLSQIAGIGAGSASTLIRELAGCLGLAPTPYASGTSEVELGISKAGNRRCRWLLVELAWSWLRYQPHSALTHWFNQRFAGAGKRLRRIGIVALARRLAIALWRYLEHGEIPDGARLKRREVNIAVA